MLYVFCIDRCYPVCCCCCSIGAGPGVSGFLTSHSITNRASLIHQFGSHVGEERVFPSMTFNCNGEILSWTFVVDECPDSISAGSSSSSIRATLPFKIWNTVSQNDRSGDLYHAQSNGTAEEWTVLQKVNQLCLVTANHSTAVQFQPGDILGIDERRLQFNGTALLYQLNGGPINHIRRVFNSSNLTISSHTVEGENDYPLVAVDSGKSMHCMVINS